MIFYTGDSFPQWKGNIFVGGLAGLALHRLAFNEKGGLLGREALLTEVRQRIRDVRQGPDGNIYVAVDANPGGVLRIEASTGGDPHSGPLDDGAILAACDAFRPRPLRLISRRSHEDGRASTLTGRLALAARS